MEGDFQKIRSMQSTLQTFGDERDCLLATDVLALADVMEAFRRSLQAAFKLDLAHS